MQWLAVASCRDSPGLPPGSPSQQGPLETCDHPGHQPGLTDMPLAGGEKGHMELRSSKKMGGKLPREEGGRQPSSPGWKKTPLSVSFGLPPPEGQRARGPETGPALPAPVRSSTAAWRLGGKQVLGWRKEAIERVVGSQGVQRHLPEARWS